MNERTRLMALENERKKWKNSELERNKESKIQYLFSSQ